MNSVMCRRPDILFKLEFNKFNVGLSLQHLQNAYSFHIFAGEVFDNFHIQKFSVPSFYGYPWPPLGNPPFC